MISIGEIYVDFPFTTNNSKNITPKNHPIFKSSKQTKLDNTKRSNILKDQLVLVVEKQNQGTSNYTKGKVQDILTKKMKHTRGIKVRLHNGIVGRITKIL